MDLMFDICRLHSQFQKHQNLETKTRTRLKTAISSTWITEPLRVTFSRVAKTFRLLSLVYFSCVCVFGYLHAGECGQWTAAFSATFVVMLGLLGFWVVYVYRKWLKEPAPPDQLVSDGSAPADMQKIMP